MKKRMIIMLICLALIFGSIIGWYFFKQHMIAQYMQGMQHATSTVSTVEAKKETWQPLLKEVGSLVAINGVDVTTQSSGIVSEILFEPGSMVKKGDVLLILDDRKEQANLANYQAQLTLAEQNYSEIKELFRVGAASKNSLEVVKANLETAKANVRSAQVQIDYLHIPAPFDGKIGINLVNLGQYIQPGTAIATLQQLNPLYVEFYVAQQDLNQLHIDEPVNVTVDSNPKHIYHGKITAINSKADSETRNIGVRATLNNDDLKILPGMFGHVNVILAEHHNVITLPQTAINYNLFGDSVYVAVPNGKTPDGKNMYVLKLEYVTVGENRDNQVEITKGLKGGELVVSSGQLKVSEGSNVTINNSIEP